jgi:hypothetical protein
MNTTGPIKNCVTEMTGTDIVDIVQDTVKGFCEAVKGLSSRYTD